MERIYERDPHANPGSRRSRRPKPKPHNEKMDLLLFYILPFIIVNGILFLLVAAKPHITVQVSNPKAYKTAQASITVNALLPIKELASAQEGSPLELTREKGNRYTAEISKNGVIEVYAKLVNGMTAVQYEHVNILDDTAPSVSDQYSIQDGILTLTLMDSQSGLDYLSVHATNPAGEPIAPLSMDRQTGSFTFPIGEESLIIHAQDLAGNGMQATFSTHMEVLNPDGTAASALPGETAQNPPDSGGDAATFPAQTGGGQTATSPAQTGGGQAATSPTQTGGGQAATSPAQTGGEKAASSPAQTGGATIYIDTTAP